MLLGHGSLLFPLQEKALGELLLIHHGYVFRHGEFAHQTLHPPLLRHQRKAGLHGGGGLGLVLPAAHIHLAAHQSVYAENRPRRFALAGAYHAGHAQYLALVHRHAHVLELAVAQAVQPQHLAVIVDAASTGKALVLLLAHHHTHDPAAVYFAALQRAHLLPVLKDRHPV